MNKPTKIEMNGIKNIKIDKAYENFIKFCKVKNLSSATIEYYNGCWDKFLRFFQGDLQNIDKNLIDNFKLSLQEDKNVSDISVNTYLRGIRAILYYFMKLGYIEKFHIKISKAEKKIKETYTDAELIILLKKPNIKKCTFDEYRDWVIINFFMSTGCRSRTLCNIKIKDLDLDSGIVLFTTTKNKKQQIVPLNEQICLILQEYLTYRQAEDEEEYLFVSIYGEQLNANSLGHSIKDYNNRRGVMKQGIHLFRHTFAKKWIQNGGNMFSLQKILGHSTLDMVKEYVNLFSEDVRRDYDKYNPLQQFYQKNYINMKKGGKK
jgi:integrase/recombinase XerD